MTDYVEKAKQLIADNKYLMLSKSWCPDCHYTYAVFESLGVKDKVHIIELDKFDDQTEAEKLEGGFTAVVGRKWVPTIFFNGENFDEGYLKKLKSDNQLESFFKKHGLI